MIRRVLSNQWARKLKPYLDDLARGRTQSADQTRKELGTRLLDLVRYFGGRGDALPQWREAAQIRDTEDLWKFWPSLPILTKHDLQTRFEPNAMRERFGLLGSISSTGGSTGEPTPYLHDPQMLLATTAARHFARLQCGWYPGLATICLWGSERDIGKQRTLRNRFSACLRNEWLVDGYSLGDQTVDRVRSLLRRHRRVAVYGFTSMLEFVARELLAQGTLPPPGQVLAAWNGGEMLFPEQSELFRRAFGVPILNFYGGRELSAMACQTALGDSLQVLRPLVFVEIVDEAGNPAPPGQSGRLVWTSTVCRGTPLLRYDVGDIGCSAPEDQDEAGVRALTQLQGRAAGLLKLPTGKTINCLFWNHLFKEFQEVQHFQVVIVKDRELLLNLKGTPWAGSREDHLRRILRQFLGEMPVRVAWVDRIPLSAQAKLVQVVRQP